MAPLSNSLSNGLHRILPRVGPKPPYKDLSYTPGGFSIPPNDVNNKGFFALFALLGVAMVLASIWFFFWAKNGGFVFRKGDWEEYKSTVLRRKGPNGTTLSGATRTTKLGGGSVVADMGVIEEEKGGWKRGVQKKVMGKGIGKKGNTNNEDADVRAYRHEKPARVGGLNREADGIVGQEYAAAFGETGTLSSDNLSTGISAGGYVPINTPRRPKTSKPPAAASPSTPTPRMNNRYSHVYAAPGSNASTDSHRPLRPNAASPGSGTSTPTRATRQHSPSKSARGSMPGSFYNEPLDFETRYTATASEAGTEDSRGTKAYFHPIPGLGRTGKKEGGFRRAGGYGRGGSLSDSD